MTDRPQSGPDRPQDRAAPRRSGWATGLLAAPVIGLACAAALVGFDTTTVGLRTLDRMLENLVLHMVIAAALGTLALIWLRAPRGLIALCAGLILVATVQTGATHLRLSAPLQPDRPAAFTLLWFNMLKTNRTPPEALADALIASDADVVFVSEAAPLADQMDRLAETYPAHLGCAPGLRCELLAMARDPAAEIALHRIGRTGEPRLAVLRLPRESGPPATLVGLHLMKPWFYGITESEEADMLDRIRDLDGPLVMAGDFNAAPWSLRLNRLARHCGLVPPRLPLPTWPAAAGWAGLPIDHVLTRDAALVSLDRWGAGLGSNHLGLLARISLEGADWTAPRPHACRLVAWFGLKL